MIQTWHDTLPSPKAMYARYKHRMIQALKYGTSIDTNST